jgi:hypothetical protein
MCHSIPNWEIAAQACDLVNIYRVEDPPQWQRGNNWRVREHLASYPLALTIGQQEDRDTLCHFGTYHIHGFTRRASIPYISFFILSIKKHQIFY